MKEGIWAYFTLFSSVFSLHFHYNSGISIVVLIFVIAVT